jgi:hypothetical protein
MAIRLPRHILPFAAVAALAGAVFVVATSQPDRTGTVPAKAPPTAPAEQRSGTVSGAGVVEPSSELIEVGAQRPGVVTRVAVQVGDRVGKGQLLFAVDCARGGARRGRGAGSVGLARERVDAARVELASAQRLLDLVTSSTIRAPLPGRRSSIAARNAMRRGRGWKSRRPRSGSRRRSCPRHRPIRAAGGAGAAQRDGAAGEHARGAICHGRAGAGRPGPADGARRDGAAAHPHRH